MQSFRYMPAVKMIAAEITIIVVGLDMLLRGKYAACEAEYACNPVLGVDIGLGRQRFITT